MPLVAPTPDERLAGAVEPRGWDPATVPAGWLDPLADAGIPFAARGEPWDAEVDPALELPRQEGDDRLVLPSLERFRTLTSLPLKPVRRWVQWRQGVRLQVGTGVRLWLWSNRLLLRNGASVHRGGFVHGPQRGMRAVIALDPEQTLVVSW
jgi:hypothetical protein